MLQENETFKIVGMSIIPNQLLVRIEIFDETGELSRYEEVPVPVNDEENHTLDLLVAGVFRLIGETVASIHTNTS